MCNKLDDLGIEKVLLEILYKKGKLTRSEVEKTIPILERLHEEKKEKTKGAWK